jgi:L-threonylcarbamoyladenylate synthase
VPNVAARDRSRKPSMPVEPATRMLDANRDSIAAAAHALAEGGLVAFPTETVYGLGADATNGAAVARLYAAKGRPRFNPLIAHVADARSALPLAQFSDEAKLLAGVFWPGPLTLVLPKRADCAVSDLATAGLDSIAVRVPDHPVARELLKVLGKPVVAPSANQSGHISPTLAAHVHTDLDGRIDLILDGGPTSVGVESTIVSFLGPPILLRPGGLPREAIARVLGHDLAEAEPAADNTPLAPGMLTSHYAPRAPVRLNAIDVRPGEALLAFGRAAPGAERTLNLSPTGDLVEAAANLFSHLRTLDASGASGIAVMSIPNEELGEAINDRLMRAAAPRRA